MQDLFNNVNIKQVISPVIPTDDTAQVGTIVDRQGYESVTYVIATGTLADADATFTALLEEGDASDLSDAAAVADVDLLGTEVLASFAFDDDDSVFKLGYKGTKRYTRLTITPANNTGNAPMAAVAVMGHPALAPTANPPA